MTITCSIDIDTEAVFRLENLNNQAGEWWQLQKEGQLQGYTEN